MLALHFVIRACAVAPFIFLFSDARRVAAHRGDVRCGDARGGHTTCRGQERRGEIAGQKLATFQSDARMHAAVTPFHDDGDDDAAKVDGVISANLNRLRHRRIPTARHAFKLPSTVICSPYLPFLDIELMAIGRSREALSGKMKFHYLFHMRRTHRPGENVKRGEEHNAGGRRDGELFESPAIQLPVSTSLTLFLSFSLCAFLKTFHLRTIVCSDSRS